MKTSTYKTAAGTTNIVVELQVKAVFHISSVVIHRYKHNINDGIQRFISLPGEEFETPKRIIESVSCEIIQKYMISAEDFSDLSQCRFSKGVQNLILAEHESPKWWFNEFGKVENRCCPYPWLDTIGRHLKK